MTIFQRAVFVAGFALATIAFSQNYAFKSDATVITAGQTSQDSTGWEDTGTKVRLLNSTDSVVIGYQTQALSKFDIYTTDNGTTNTLDVLALRRSSSGTPGTNFGTAIQAYLKSNGGVDRTAGRIQFRWSTASDASRTSYTIFSTVNSTSQAEAMRLAPGGLNIGGSATPTNRLEVKGATMLYSTDTDTTYIDPGTRFYGIDMRQGGTRMFAVDTVGNVYKQDILDIPANAWTSTATNGATDTTINYLVLKSFSNSTAETMFVDISIPKYFVSIDSLQLDVFVGTAAGDSTGWKIQHSDLADGEALTAGGYSAAVSFTSRDMGATANLRKILSYPTAFSGIVALDNVRFKLYRDVSIANNAAVRAKVRGMRIYGRGLK